MAKLKPEPWWPRFFAWLIDAIILSIISWILFSPFQLHSWSMMGGWNFAAHGANGMLGLLYWGFLDSEGRRSIGKKALKLQQIKLNGKKPEIIDGFISAFGKAFLLPIDMIIGVLARPGRKQRLFSIASDTTVVKG